MNSEVQNLLDDVVAFCIRDGQDKRLIQMLSSSTPLDLDDDEFTIRAPTRFGYSYLLKHAQEIDPYLEEITFLPITLSIEPPAEAEPGAGEGAQPGSSAQSQQTAPYRRSAADSSTDGNPSHATVTTTLSSADYRRLMADMAAQEPVNRPAPSPAPAPRDPSSDRTLYEINSKFTFDTFVSGVENRLAFTSSQSFAAFADDPTRYNSLFIYGKSGLGKTHLLFAIKNYLLTEKPHIRVKYANSQAYLDDYMHDLGMQRRPGEPIMSEYREADILIIDDIQNIIGKQASIEYFFQLVDEFIRNGKKIAIASDRAPKNLGFDERLTSRFNSGMLCLVSEPGFEMKYTILKRYYENIILGSSELPALNVETSLLNALQVREGHLTDQQLRHMAEISGNNIRELESFCERCAGLSSEREAAGAELTAEDIDRVAAEYFDTAHKVIHIDTVQKIVEEYYHVSHEELIGPRRTANIAQARHIAVYLAYNLCEMTTPAIGAEFGGRDHSTVLNSLKVVENKMKEDRRICDDLQHLKNKIILRS